MADSFTFFHEYSGVLVQSTFILAERALHFPLTTIVLYYGLWPYMCSTMGIQNYANSA